MRHTPPLTTLPSLLCCLLLLATGCTGTGQTSSSASSASSDDGSSTSSSVSSSLSSPSNFSSISSAITLESSSQQVSSTAESSSSVTTKPGVVFEDNFEAGALMTLSTPWIGSTGPEASLAEQVVVSDENAFSGERALKVKSGGGNAFSFIQLPNSLASSNDVYVRFYMYAENKIGQNGGNRSSFLKLGQFIDNGTFTSDSQAITLGEGQGTFGATAGAYNGATYPRQFVNDDNIIPTNTWQCVEVVFETNVDGLAAGRITLNLEGQMLHEISATNQNDWQQAWQNGPPAANWLTSAFGQSLGLGWDGNGNQGNTLFIDDVVVSTEPVGCSYLPGGSSFPGGNESSSSSHTTSSSAPSTIEPDPKCGGEIVFCEDFNNHAGEALPAGLSFVECGSNEGGKLEFANEGLDGSRAAVVSNYKGYCGSAIDTEIIRQMDRGYARFHVRERTEGNSLRMLLWLEDGPLADRNGYSWRLRINGRDLHWNRADVGDTVAPDFSGAGVATTTQISSAEWNCMEVFWDNNTDVLRFWFNDELVEGLVIDGIFDDQDQIDRRWYRDHISKFGEYDMDINMIRVGHDGANAGTTVIDNIAVSESRIGCDN